MSLTLNEYQEGTEYTRIYPDNVKVLYPAMGLAGEAGEILNKLKKVYRDDGGVLSEEKRLAIIDELGDVLYYVAALALDLEIDLESVSRANLEKLASRKTRNTLSGSGDNR